MILTERSLNKYFVEPRREITRGHTYGAGFWDKIKSFGRRLIRPIAGFVKDKVVPLFTGKAKSLANTAIGAIANKAHQKFPNYSGFLNPAEIVIKNKANSLIDSLANKGNTLIDSVAQKYGTGTRRKARGNGTKKVTHKTKPVPKTRQAFKPVSQKDYSKWLLTMV